MKKLVTLFVLVSICFGSMAQQKALTLQDAEKLGITISKLDQEYGDALNSDSTRMVFKNRTNEFIKAYKNLLMDLGSFLKQNNFKLEQPIRVFHRIYFRKDGKIEHYLINLASSGLSAERQTRMMVLLNEFVDKNKIGITADRDFAQCSPAVYKN